MRVFEFARRRLAGTEGARGLRALAQEEGATIRISTIERIFVLDLNEVAMFVQVVRCGSFAEAARRLNMPSPTVSRRIQQLEARLGTRLMQRSTRKLELTSAGRAF